MGLMIHSLAENPLEVERSYYIYLLDYGWYEPLAEAVYQNFAKLADLASRRGAVVMRGLVAAHFADEVLSWHHVNGQPAEEILPAILLTTIHPHRFRSQTADARHSLKDKMLLIPLRAACKSTSDVVTLVEKIFRDIKEKKGLPDFAVAQELRKGKRGALVDALILQPRFAGMGVDLKRLVAFFKGLRG
ncbi:MAG: hypothetical protein ACLQVY_12570 [Limisphaerales bacterium]